MVKAIVFDIGGVLYDEATFQRIYTSIAERLGIDPAALTAAKDRHMNAATEGKYTAAEHIKRLAATLHVPSAALRKTWEEEYLRHVALDVEIDDLLRRLKGTCILAALTNVTTLHHALRKKAGVFYKRFDLVVASCEQGFRKPQPQFYKLLLDKLQLPAHEVLFIDDNNEYLIPAQHLGIETIHYQSPAQLLRDLQRFGVKL